MFATVDCGAGDLLEVAPVLVIPADEWDLLRATSLAGYVWGHANLLNHSYEPNCRYEHDLDAGTVEVLAIGPIRAGEEVTINYNGDPDDRSPLWFDVSA